MNIIIVCHTESKGSDVSKLIKIADKYKAKITFAVKPEIAKDFPKNINHEIGLHIHPTDTYIREHYNLSLNSHALRDYPYNEQYEMIKTGKKYLMNEISITQKRNFSFEPKVFVAGKWSVNNNTIKALVELGFTHDCSASQRKEFPYCNWSELPRICLPYIPNKYDYQIKGIVLPILEVPVSQMWKGGEVSPESVPVVGMWWLKASFLEYYYKKIPLYHIYLHSQCMSNLKCAKTTDELLKFISKFNVDFKFVSEIK